jgi:hypothetical protein
VFALARVLCLAGMRHKPVIHGARRMPVVSSSSQARRRMAFVVIVILLAQVFGLGVTWAVRAYVVALTFRIKVLPTARDGLGTIQHHSPAHSSLRTRSCGHLHRDCRRHPGRSDSHNPNLGILHSNRPPCTRSNITLLQEATVTKN